MLREERRPVLQVGNIDPVPWVLAQGTDRRSSDPVLDLEVGADAETAVVKLSMMVRALCRLPGYADRADGGGLIAAD